jgi:hypothetical protein
MVKADGAVACEATFVIAFFDTKARKIIEPSPAWKKALGYLD